MEESEPTPTTQSQETQVHKSELASPPPQRVVPPGTGDQDMNRGSALINWGLLFG